MREQAKGLEERLGRRRTVRHGGRNVAQPGRTLNRNATQNRGTSPPHHLRRKRHACDGGTVSAGKSNDSLCQNCVR